MTPEKGYIKIKGKINGFDFKKTLVPVKNAPYRLFVNSAMMKGGRTALGEMANFIIEQDFEKVVTEYPIPSLLIESLKKDNLTAAFDDLTSARKKDILKYLNAIKTEDTLVKNISKLISQLKNRDKNVRIP